MGVGWVIVVFNGPGEDDGPCARGGFWTGGAGDGAGDGGAGGVVERF